MTETALGNEVTLGETDNRRRALARLYAEPSRARDEHRNGVVRKSEIFVITRAPLSDDEAE